MAYAHILHGRVLRLSFSRLFRYIKLSASGIKALVTWLQMFL